MKVFFRHPQNGTPNVLMKEKSVSNQEIEPVEQFVIQHVDSLVRNP